MAEQPQAGQTFGRYQLIEQIGEGGMAAVYKAHDPQLDRTVAIKVVLLGNFPEKLRPELLKRFDREAKLLAKLSHPNIVRIFDFGVQDGQPYLVMEYLPGGALSQFCGTPMPYAEAARWLAPVAQALHYAHQKGMLRRDVKPDNILINEDGKPVLSDFGIARALAGTSTVTLSSGVRFGSPTYMSPEQIQGKEIDARSDVYALGCVFYELVAGHPPFSADNDMALMYQHVHEPAPRLAALIPGLPPTVDEIVQKALSKVPGERYRDMSVFAGELEKLAKAHSTSSVTTLSGYQAFVPPKPLPQPQSEAPKPAPIPAPPRLPPQPQNHPPRPSEETMARPVEIPVIPKPARQAVRSSPPPAAPRRVSRIGLALGGLAVLALILFVWQWWESKIHPVATIAPVVTPILTATSFSVADTEPPSCTAVGQKWVSPVDGMTLVCVPAGEFIMGANDADKEALPDEKPQHKVTLSAYWIDQTEVTNAQYQQCVQAGRCSPRVYGNSSNRRQNYYGNSQFSNYPMILVIWDDAKKYCTWAGRDLPTEAEWEKAARGTDGRIYPWGSQAPDGTLLNFNDLKGDTTAVGSYPLGASPYGALDMAGNVYEWVADWYSETYYNTSPSMNPTGPASGQYRVMRGGPWSYEKWAVRASDRDSHDPGSSGFNLGFRCSRDDSLLQQTPTAPAVPPTSAATPNSQKTLTATPIIGSSTPACTAVGQKWVSPVDGMTLVCVPAGEFIMGANDLDRVALSDEKRTHRVTLSAYWIDQTEVTNGMYQQCVQAGKCSSPSIIDSNSRKKYFGDSQYANYPMISVSWDDAQKYCAWAGRKLPTEAEWEKAARGGDSRIYPWGNQDPSKTLLNYDNYQKGDTTVVGAYPQGASPYGALDMAGNVWEWVADWYSDSYYQSSPSNNPTGPSSGQSRILRGGSYDDGYSKVRSSARLSLHPDIRTINFGFRCSR